MATLTLTLLLTLTLTCVQFWEDPVYGFLNTFLVELDKVRG